jgi:filamentous hemagglutinin family protein
VPGLASAADLPEGAQVAAGEAQFSQSATTLNIQQNSDRLITNWQSFNIGQGNTVNFVQPSASSVALNRVVGSDPSRIQGALNANGQVFLVNPNGVLFAPGAQVNVGGIVATTHSISDKNFLEGRYQFGGQSPHAVVNQGNINSARGGYVSLVAARVVNQGTINTPEGQVLLGAGSEVLLDFGAAVKLLVKAGALNAMIESGGVIRAEGGLVYMSAKSAGDLAATVINHTGIIEAQTLSTGKRGEVYLMGDLGRDAIKVDGRIDASAPQGGDGGFVETSAARVSFGGQVNINTSAASGQTGTWLIDPTDFYISASGGDITGAILSSMLTQNDVIIETATGPYVPLTLFGSRPGNGDIFVNDHVSYAYHRLTLRAERDILVDATISLDAATAYRRYGGLSLFAGRDVNINRDLVVVDVNNVNTLDLSITAGSDVNFNATATLNNASMNVVMGGQLNMGMSGSSFLGRVVMLENAAQFGRLTINTNPYTLINAYSDLYNLPVNGYYALRNDLNADYVLRAPINDPAMTFWGVLDGLGHRILNLNITGQTYLGQTGLFSVNGGTIQNLGLESGFIDSYGYDNTGALAGANSGTIRNVYSKVNVSGNDYVGGLVGYNSGTLYNAHVSATVQGNSIVGGLVGQSSSSGSIDGAYFYGSVYGQYNLGGLVGSNASPISNSNAGASVIAQGSVFNVGGLVGVNDGGTIRAGSVSGCVSVNSNNCGGILNSSGGNIDNIGGLIGSNNNASVIDSHAYNNVYIYNSADNQVQTSSVGGLIGGNYINNVTTSISGSSARGSIVSEIQAIPSEDSTIQVRNQYIGGLVGYNGDRISILNSTSSGSLTVSTYVYQYNNNNNAQESYVGANYVGGLVGYLGSNSSIINTQSGSQVYINNYLSNNIGSTHYNSKLNIGYVGGLVGMMASNSNISASSASGSLSLQSSQSSGGASFEMNAYAVGGLVGFVDDSVSISNTRASANVDGYLNIYSYDYNSNSNYGNRSYFYGVGGLIGLSDSNLVLTDSHATGAVSLRSNSQLYLGANNNNNNNSFDKNFNGVGGLVGLTTLSTTMRGVSSSGDILIHSEHYLSTTVDQTYVSANTYSNINNVGGLLGGSGMYYFPNFDNAGWISTNFGQLGNSSILDASSSSDINIRHAYNRSNNYLIQYTNSYHSFNSYAVGGLVGSLGSYMSTGNNDVVEQSNATGSITIQTDFLDASQNNTNLYISQIGGLVGFSSAGYSPYNKTSIIRRSFADVDIVINVDALQANLNYGYITAVGGLVGTNGGYSTTGGYGLIQDSYALGSIAVDASSIMSNYYNYQNGIGGLVGFNERSGLVENSYSVGSVTQLGLSNRVGGLVGGNEGSVTASFWDVDRSGLLVSAAGQGLSSVDMQNASLFTAAGWDMAGVWRLTPEFTSPRLRVFNPPPPASLPIPPASLPIPPASLPIPEERFASGLGARTMVNNARFSQQLVSSSVQAMVASLGVPPSAQATGGLVRPMTLAMNQTGGNTLAGGLINLSGGGMSYGAASSGQVGSNDED